MNTYRSDNDLLGKLLPFLRPLASLAATFVVMLTLKASVYWLVAIGTFMVFSIAIVSLRLAWGDRVDVGAEGLRVYKGQDLKFDVAWDQVTRIISRPGSLLLATHPDRKPRAVVLPAESFTRATFEALRSDVLAHAPDKVAADDAVREDSATQ